MFKAEELYKLCNDIGNCHICPKMGKEEVYKILEA